MSLRKDRIRLVGLIHALDGLSAEEFQSRMLELVASIKDLPAMQKNLLKYEMVRTYYRIPSYPLIPKTCVYVPRVGIQDPHRQRRRVDRNAQAFHDHPIFRRGPCRNGGQRETDGGANMLTCKRSRL